MRGARASDARAPNPRRANAARSRENVDAIRGRVVHRSIVRRVRREVSSERARERERARRVRETQSLSGRRRPRGRSTRCPRARCEAHAPARAQAAMMDFGELFVVPVCTEHRVGSEELAANGGEDSAAGNHEVRCVLGDARWATRRPRRGRRPRGGGARR